MSTQGITVHHMTSDDLHKECTTKSADRKAQPVHVISIDQPQACYRNLSQLGHKWAAQALPHVVSVPHRLVQREGADTARKINIRRSRAPTQAKPTQDPVKAE